MRFTQTHLSSVPVSLWMASLPPGVWTAALSLPVATLPFHLTSLSLPLLSVYQMLHCWTSEWKLHESWNSNDREMPEWGKLLFCAALQCSLAEAQVSILHEMGRSTSDWNATDFIWGRVCWMCLPSKHDFHLSGCFEWACEDYKLHPVHVIRQPDKEWSYFCLWDLSE